MHDLTAFVSNLNSVLWGPFCLIPLLVGTGIYFSFKLRFLQVRRFGRAASYVLRHVKFFGNKADGTGMSSFQSLATAIAAQVGTGNLAGVATALAMGGPGAIFWMWLAAFFGMATIFVEAVLAQHFKTKDANGHVTGGPAYYITNGLHCKPLAMFFSVAIIIALGFIGNMVQANSIALAFDFAFGIPPWVVGVVIALIAAFIFIGGIRRIASTTEKIVPIMALFYLAGGLIVLIEYFDQIIPSFEMIFVGAFNPTAATGGVIGASVKEAIRYGVARGLFSNEAGMGSTPHAHAVAKVDHPAKQGLLDGKTTGIALTQHAFQLGLGSFGYGFVAICLLFFAFSTIIGWYFFAEQNVKFLFGPRYVRPYQYIVVLFIFLGSLLQVNLVWELADLFNGLMVIPNLIALIGLGKIASEALNDYEFRYIPEKLKDEKTAS